MSKSFITVMDDFIKIYKELIINKLIEAFIIIKIEGKLIMSE